MRWFNDLSVQVKLMSGFGLVLLLTAAIAVLGIIRLQQASDRTAAMYRENVLGVQHALQTNAAMIASAREEKRAFLTNDADTRKALIEQSRQHMDNAKQYMQEYHVTFASEADAEQWAEVEKKVLGVIESRETVLQLLESGDVEGASAAAAAMNEAIADMNRTLDESGQFNADIADGSRAAAASAASSARMMMIAVTIVAIVIAMGVAYYISRNLKNTVGQVLDRLTSLAQKDGASLQAGLRAFAEGDLTAEAVVVTEAIGSPGKDEVGRAAAATNIIRDQMAAMAEAYDEARKGLAALIGVVQKNAQGILSAADQLQQASDQMAAATGQISSAIGEVTSSAVSLSDLSRQSAQQVEQVAAGSQELTAAAQSNADGAASSKDEAVQMGERIRLVAQASERVATSAEESRSTAQAGQESVVQAVASMQAIAEAVGRASRTVNQLGEYGEQIGNIVQTIDEIAAQTNLLALNAAIEAARAGEQGRGFAVVADNVRTLAERSSQATKEIAELIAKVQEGTQEAVVAMEAGVKDVEAGREITGKAGEALESIIRSVQLSAEQMQKIATDVQDLASGAERIVASAESMASIAQQSAAGAEEMAQATEKVSAAILQVSSTSEQTSASAEQVSASAQELSAQSQELAATAGEMRNLANALNADAARFKLESA